MQTDDFLIHAKAEGDADGKPAPPSDRTQLLDHVRDSVTARRAVREKMRSMRQFARHRHDELNREWHRINDFVEEHVKLGSEDGVFATDDDSGIDAVPAGTVKLPADNSPESGGGIVYAKRQQNALVMHFRGLLPFYSGAVYSNSGNATEGNPADVQAIDAASTVRHCMLQTLHHSFGLERVARCGESVLVDMESYLERLFVTADNAQHTELNLSELFPTGDSVHAREKSIMLEIGSGNGEWIAAQAVHDTGKRSNWISLEQRHDRVYTSFTHKVFNNIANLCVMGGDAAMVCADGLIKRDLIP